MSSEEVKVGDVMRTSLHTIDGVASVQDAIDEMRRLSLSSLVIERRHEGDEHGIVTVQDIAAQVVSVNRAAQRTSVYEVMTKPALTLGAAMHVKYAIRLLSRLGLGCALVTDGEGLRGFVTLRDLVLAYTDDADQVR